MNARAAGFMVLPLTNNALTSIEPKSQSGRTRMRAPLSNSALALLRAAATMPNPLFAPAIAPSLIVTVNWLLTRTEAMRPSLLNENVGQRCAGPMITACCARSDGISGVPRSLR